MISIKSILIAFSIWKSSFDVRLRQTRQGPQQKGISIMRLKSERRRGNKTQKERSRISGHREWCRSTAAAMQRDRTSHVGSSVFLVRSFWKLSVEMKLSMFQANSFEKWVLVCEYFLFWNFSVSRRSILFPPFWVKWVRLALVVVLLAKCEQVLNRILLEERPICSLVLCSMEVGIIPYCSLVLFWHTLRILKYTSKLKNFEVPRR